MLELLALFRYLCLQDEQYIIRYKGLGLQESLQNLQCRSTVWIPNPLLKYQYYSHMST